MADVDIVVTCAKGTERALKFELKDLGLSEVKGGEGAVTGKGDRSLVGAVNVFSRIGHSVLVELASFDADNEAALVEQLSTVRFEELIAKKCTFAIRAHLKNAPLTHSLHVERRVKDVVVDRFVSLSRERPTVDKKTPAVRLVLRWEKTRATLLLDTTGKSLSHRGYRPGKVKAPLRESLAAAMLALGHADVNRPFIDPCCGSGTLAIEQAWRALGRAPGKDRRFAIDRWPGDAMGYGHGFALARERAADEERTALPAPIFLSDWHPEAIQFAEQSVQAAGLEGVLVPERVDARQRDYDAPRPTIFSNLPYGERLSKNQLQLDGFYRTLGARLAAVDGARVCLLTLYAGAERLLGLGPPGRKWSLYSGPLRVTLRRWDIGDAGSPKGTAGEHEREPQ